MTALKPCIIAQLYYIVQYCKRTVFFYSLPVWIAIFLKTKIDYNIKAYSSCSEFEIQPGLPF